MQRERFLLLSSAASVCTWKDCAWLVQQASLTHLFPDKLVLENWDGVWEMRVGEALGTQEGTSKSVSGVDVGGKVGHPGRPHAWSAPCPQRVTGRGEGQSGSITGGLAFDRYWHRTGRTGGFRMASNSVQSSPLSQSYRGALGGRHTQLHKGQR